MQTILKLGLPLGYFFFFFLNWGDSCLGRLRSRELCQSPFFRRILTPWIFLSSRYGRLGMGFCTSQKYSSTSRKIDVRTIGFEPAFTVGTSDSDPPLYDHGYLGEAEKEMYWAAGWIWLSSQLIWYGRYVCIHAATAPSARGAHRAKWQITSTFSWKLIFYVRSPPAIYPWCTNIYVESVQFY